MIIKTLKISLILNKWQLKEGMRPASKAAIRREVKTLADQVLSQLLLQQPQRSWALNSKDSNAWDELRAMYTNYRNTHCGGLPKSHKLASTSQSFLKNIKMMMEKDSAATRYQVIYSTRGSSERNPPDQSVFCIEYGGSMHWSCWTKAGRQANWYVLSHPVRVSKCPRVSRGSGLLQRPLSGVRGWPP